MGVMARIWGRIPEKVRVGGFVAVGSTYYLAVMYSPALGTIESVWVALVIPTPVAIAALIVASTFRIIGRNRAPSVADPTPAED
jgi:hypothetical protein